MKRRSFFERLALGTAGLAISPTLLAKSSKDKSAPGTKPLIISTWNHGFAANDAALATLKEGGTILDAVEKGVNVPESDPEVTSVGYGGLPDREGKVTLDACIMDKFGNCGSVAYLQHIKNPISVARLVMQKTPHIMLVGEGALSFALSQGFRKEELLTEKASKRWEEWLKKSDYSPKINIENHDTIGMLGIDENGDLSGACTTSGLAWKMDGRVGDSPLIGAGLFVDNEVGAATATGKGEAVIKIAGAALVVELMRQGRTPMQACAEAVNRIATKQKDAKSFQVGFLALNKNGEHGAYALHQGFNYAYHCMEKQEMRDSAFLFQTKVDTY